MQSLELRPLSLGEILDRTFTLYKTHFVLFVALAGISRLPAILASFLQVQASIGAVPTVGTSLLGFVVAIVGLIGYLFSQGSAVIAVSELYMGRSITIVEALRRVTGEIGSLFGVLMLNGLAIIAGFIALIVPGVILICRLLVCVPAAVVEGKGPRDSLSRSMDLTKGFAGRAFVIFGLYFVLSLAFGAMIEVPIGMATRASGNDPAALRTWLSIQMVIASALEVLLTPVLLIATSIFYYDLRVRKEALDLDLMMDPEGAHVPANPNSIVPGIR